MPSRPNALPAGKWRRRSADRPDEILDAALDVFIEQGFDAARMEDIGARAGISKAGIYLYFDGKVALLKALIRREVAPVTERAAVLAEAGRADPEAALRQIVRTILGVMLQPRVFAIPRLMFAISNRFPEIAEYYRTEVIAHGMGALRGLIDAGIAKGVFRPVDPDLALRSIIGPMMFTAIWHHVLNGEPDTDPGGTAQKLIDVILNGLRRSTP
ncbi:MAG: TetR/AcrR family transcriptional regulator [Alphaproteobacteria bacterium]|nr:TetR/AcrR family transcriptional regulator [Alphaproteobacteria bacterium]